MSDDLTESQMEAYASLVYLETKQGYVMHELLGQEELTKQFIDAGLGTEGNELPASLQNRIIEATRPGFPASTANTEPLPVL